MTIIDERSCASTESDEIRYPIKMEYHRNRYASTLFDVDGCVLTGMTGEPLNVFKEELKDMMMEKLIWFVHYMAKEPTYAYFVITQEQRDRFQYEREYGSLERNKVYHVYIDN